jgi:hypothetical protein
MTVPSTSPVEFGLEHFASTDCGGPVLVQVFPCPMASLWSRGSQVQNQRWLWEASVPSERDKVLAHILDTMRLSKGGREGVVLSELVAVGSQGLVVPFKAVVTFRTARAWMVRHLPPNV